jgi:hypothetical protein
MKLSTLVTVWFAVLVIGAVIAIGASTPKRIEIETGRNTLEMRQAIERERLATKEQMQQRQIEAEAARRYEYIEAEKELQRRRIDAAAGRQKAYIEAQQERDAERQRQKCLRVVGRVVYNNC